jgi:hypothetical protein
MSNLTIVAFAAKLATYADTRSRVAVAHRWLRDNAPKLKNAEKIEVDRIVVTSLAKIAKLELIVSTSPKAPFSKLTVEGDAKTDPEVNRVRSAISHARRFLKGAGVKEQGTAIERATKALESALASDDMEKRNEAVRAVKALMLLVRR